MMGDYTTARCHLLLGNPTTNIEYINGATMADDLEKYEALAGAVENIDFDGALFQKCATAITELVAMVREANRILDSSGAELYAAKSDCEQMRERAEAAERERDEARDLTWFWQIVDRNGLSDVCSDERSALAELARAHRELAELRSRPDALRADKAEKALEEAEEHLDACMNSFSGETDAMRFNHAERALAVILAARGEKTDG